MNEEAVIQRLIQLNERYQAQWDADVAAVRILVAEEESLPLRMGDLFIEIKTRWNGKMRDLAQETGVSPHTARQRARIAARFPSGSPIRSLALPFSIMRLLAPLDQPEPWAERARALQSSGELHVRAFARALEDAGLRRPRARRPSHCLHCGCEIAEGAEHVFVRQNGQAGRLCGDRCAAAYFAASRPTRPPVTLPATAQPKPAPPRRAMLFPAQENTESHRHTAQSKIQNPKSKIEPLSPPPPVGEEARIRAALALQEEAGVGRLLCRRLPAALEGPPGRPPEPGRHTQPAYSRPRSSG